MCLDNIKTFRERLALLNNHFNDIPFVNCWKFYKICVILADCKDVHIFDQGNIIYFEGNSFIVFDLVMCIYYKSISKKIKLITAYEMMCNKLRFLDLLQINF